MLFSTQFGQVCASAEDWLWSSYRAMMGKAPVPEWLAVKGLLRLFDTRRSVARRRYRRFAIEGVDEESVWVNLKQQIYLGDETFVERVQERAGIADEMTIPRVQRRPPAPEIAELETCYTNRNEAIVAAYATGAYSYNEIAEYFGLHLVTVGGIVRTGLKRNNPEEDEGRL